MADVPEQPAAEINESILSEDFKKKAYPFIAKWVDEALMITLPIMGVKAPPSDMEKFRNLMVDLELGIHLIDNVVEEAQRRNLPWNVDSLIAKYIKMFAEIGALDKPFSATFIETNIKTYFQLETDIMETPHAVDLSTIRNVWSLRSLDMKAIFPLAVVVFQMEEETVYNPYVCAIMDTIWKVSEVGMDAEDYKKDIAENSFNTYRLFTDLYGTDGAMRALKKELKSIRSDFHTAVKHLPTWKQRRAAKKVFSVMWKDIKYDLKLQTEEKTLPPELRPKYAPPRPFSLKDNWVPWEKRQYNTTITTIKK